MLAGYLVPWRWTGFTGNSLWDWLSRALLPLVIATSTMWRGSRDSTRRQRSLVTAGVVLAVLVVLAGDTDAVQLDRGSVAHRLGLAQARLLAVLVPTLMLPRVGRQHRGGRRGTGSTGIDATVGAEHAEFSISEA